MNCVEYVVGVLSCTPVRDDEQLQQRACDAIPLCSSVTYKQDTE
jgi:hypothetical protein